jgi:hypothetical protein
MVAEDNSLGDNAKEKGNKGTVKIYEPHRLKGKILQQQIIRIRWNKSAQQLCRIMLADLL